MRIGTLLAILMCLMTIPAAASELSLLHAGSPLGPDGWGEASILQAGAGNLAVQEQIGYSNGFVAQLGVNNSASQFQAGTRNQAFTFQSGEGNAAVTNQTGTGNSASTLQYGKGNVAVTNQSGSFNSASMVQTGLQYLLVYQRGALNQLTPGQVPTQSALILQQGVNAEPTVIPLRGR